MNKVIVPIQGMHCRSCEIIIEDELSKVKRVEKSKADYKKSAVEIDYKSEKPDENEIAKAIERAGYKISKSGKQPFLSKDIKDYKDLGLALIFLIIVYFIVKNLGIINLNLTESSSGIPTILLVGVAAGFSTCMALIGGLVLGFSARHAEKHPEATAVQKFRPHLFFNLGRILGFGILGGFLGMAGSLLQLSGFTMGLIAVLVGFAMLILGFQLIEIFPRLANWRITLPKKIARIFGFKNHQEEYSHRGVFITGALTFFLPCGFTQAMQLVAIKSGSFISGGTIMAFFALGTAPGLLGIGGLTSFIKGIFAKKFFKFAGLAVILFALFNISNGYRLLGLDFNFNNSSANQQNQTSEVKIENGVETIKMAVSNGYSPNKFTIKKGVPVKWVIDVQNSYSCAATLVVPKLGIRKTLDFGENIIEFTPEEAGSINFSCIMGMYTGVFNVIE